MRSLFRPCIFVFAPLVLLPLPIIYPTSVGRCAYVLILMAVFWVTETLHLSVTSLLPMVILPLMGVVSSERAAMHYFTNTNMLYLGGLVVARAIEHRNLHKRMALYTLLKVGTNPITLILGFMLPTWFVSMWVSNVASTSMVSSISEAVIQELEKDEGSEHQNEEENEIMLGNLKISDMDYEEQSPLLRRLKNENENNTSRLFNKGYAKGASLCIAYAATCGGIGTLTGTGPNLILYGLITSRYGESSGLNFGSYMLYALPISLICLFVTWIWICVIFIGPKNLLPSNLNEVKGKQIQSILREEYSKLGKMRFSEASCVFWLLTLIFLWITRNPGYSLWGSWFSFTNSGGATESYATDTQPAVLISIILMTWPADNPFSSQYWKSETKYEPLLPWNEMQRGVPWSVLFLLGGSFALADACEMSGLSQLIGFQLTGLGTLPPHLMMFLVIVMISCITEITSNTATATIVLPLVISLAECSKIHPLYLALPGTIASSLAFCLPVSTPPNAIIFASGRVTILDMIKCGILLNFTAIMIVFVCTLSYGIPEFGLNTFPSWANKCTTIPYNKSMFIF